MKRRDRAQARGVLLVAGASVALALLVSGCAALSTPATVRVVDAPEPDVATAHPLPSLPLDDPKTPLVLSESNRFGNANVVRFIAAREAFWDYDTDAAVKRLRELRQADGIAPDYFHELVLQCYEQSGRWADTLPLYGDFGLERSHAGRLRFARLMAGLPRQEVEFAPEAQSVPMELKHGVWVIVEGTINGVKARLMLDTGAGMLAVSERLVRQAGVSVFAETLTLNDSQGAGRDSRIALVRDLRFGGIVVRNAPAVVVGSLPLRIFGVDAIVGWPTLQQLDITWDFPAKRMTIAAPSGPIRAEPNLSGRTGPIVTVLSSVGRPLDLFLDTGYSGSARSAMWLAENDGVLPTKLPLAEFRRSWLPTVSGGLHSMSVTWPLRTKPFSFWMGGLRFESPSAILNTVVNRQEQLVHVDGQIGNTPFLGGKLRVCGVRRLLEFTPGYTASPSGSESGPTGKEASVAVPTFHGRTRAVLSAADSGPAFVLGCITGNRAVLSDAAWMSAEVGWGRVTRNRFWVDDDLAVRLVLQGQEFVKGLYAHSPSRYVFPLDGRWKTLVATIGIRDGADETGSAIFTVRGDGRELYASPVLRVGTRREVAVDVTGVRELELLTRAGDDVPHFSWAIWANAQLER